MTDFLDGVRMGSFDTEYDDDTIEMVLSESAMHLLSQAAAQTESAGPVVSAAVKEPTLAEAQSTARVHGVAEADATAKVQPVAEAHAIPETRPVVVAQATSKAQPIIEAQATPKVQPVVMAQATVEAQPIAKALAAPEALTTTEPPTVVASQQPIAKDQVPPGYRPPMSTLRFALILSLVAVGSALLTAGTYFLTTRASPPVKVVTIRVPAAPAPVIAAPPPTAMASTAAQPLAAGATPAPDATASSEAPATVRFVNPFDKKEVFEFPPGTSQADARDAVADLLGERARDRRGQLVKTPHRDGKTAASGAPVVASGVSPRS